MTSVVRMLGKIPSLGTNSPNVPSIRALFLISAATRFETRGAIYLLEQNENTNSIHEEFFCVVNYNNTDQPSFHNGREKSISTKLSEHSNRTRDLKAGQMKHHIVQVICE